MGRFSPNLRKLHPQFQWITPGHRSVKRTDQKNVLVSITSLVDRHCFKIRALKWVWDFHLILRSNKSNNKFGVARVFKTAFYCDARSLISRNLDWLESLPHSCPVSVTREVQSCCMPVCRSPKYLRYKLHLSFCLNYRISIYWETLPKVLVTTGYLCCRKVLVLEVSWVCCGSREGKFIVFLPFYIFFPHNRILNYVRWMHGSYIFETGHYVVKHGGQ